MTQPRDLPPAVQTHTQMDTLAPELLSIIFRDLEDTPAINNLRLVSKAFSQLATQIKYRQVTLTDRIITCSTLTVAADDCPQSRIAQHISQYTRKVSVEHSVDYTKILPFLNSLQALRELSWTCWSQSSDLPRQIQQTFTASFRARWPHVQYRLGGACAGLFSPRRKLLSSADITNLISLKLHAGWLWTNDNTGQALKEILLNNRSLSMLYLVAHSKKSNPTYWNAQLGERLPALRELVIQGCDWPFDSSSAVNFWDWSKIIHLELSSVPLITFLETVPPEQLKALRVLHLEGNYNDYDKDEEKKAKSLIVNLLRRIHNLLSVKVSGWLFSPEVESTLAAQHGSSLRSLEYQSKGVFQEPTWLPLPLNRLNSLCSNFPMLTKLSIGLTPTHFTPFRDVSSLSSLRNLRHLHLTIPAASLGVNDINDELLGINMLAFLKDLTAKKTGVVFEQIVVSTGIRWRERDFGYLGDHDDTGISICTREITGWETFVWRMMLMDNAEARRSLDITL